MSYKKDPEDPSKMIPDYDTEFFIKKVSVKIGGIDLSGYNEEANDREDPVGYKRFNQVSRKLYYILIVYFVTYIFILGVWME